MSSSIEEVRASIARANDTAAEVIGLLYSASQRLQDEVYVPLMAAMEGSTQADTSMALGMVAQARQMIEDAGQAVSAAVTSSGDVAARL
jgi:hypothetical protein